MSVSGLTNIFKHKPLLLTNRNNSVNCKFDFSICAKAGHFEVKLSDSGTNVRGYGQFSAPVVPSNLKKSKEDEERENYHVNMGYVIRSLREDFPELFYRELSFDIYRDDIVFKDPLNNFVGIENYKSIFWALRFHGKIFFRALWIDIMSLWQPMEDMIMVRWTIHGVPRVLWESRVRFDGTSEYKLDRNGKIYEHKVDNIAINSPPKYRALGVEQLIQALGCPSTPKPTCFDIPSSSSSRSVPLMDRNSSYPGTVQDSAWDSHSLVPETSLIS